MEATMTETRWDKKLTRGCEGTIICGSCEARSTAKYNRGITGLVPLEAVGTDAYFAAVFAEARRATAPLLPAEARIKAKAPKAVRRDVDALSPQLCHYCGRSLEMGSKVHAHTLLPIVACAPCVAARSETGLTIGWPGEKGGRMTYCSKWAPARIGNG